MEGRSAHDGHPVIVLSARNAELDKVRGLESGAEDYITKPFGVLELQARVKAALRRITSDEVFRMDGLVADFSQKRVVADGREVSLTKKELELLQYLCANAGRVVTREQLLENVWGYNFGGDTTRTVDYHIRSLRKKLGDNAEDSRFVETVRGFGYRIVRPSGHTAFP
jgi:two-component system alkaline phosphatase synthesis response regulator PhoP